METKHITNSTDETRALGRRLARSIEPGRSVLFRGDLGAGKTTFIQGFLEELGAERPYVSPTFVIMKQYDLASPSPTGVARVYHMDAYRIDDPVEMERLGLEEWIADKAGVVLVEWPERIVPLLPQGAVAVSLRWISDTEREITVEEGNNIEKSAS